MAMRMIMGMRTRTTMITTIRTIMITACIRMMRTMPRAFTTRR